VVGYDNANRTSATRVTDGPIGLGKDQAKEKKQEAKDADASTTTTRTREYLNRMCDSVREAQERQEIEKQQEAKEADARATNNYRYSLKKGTKTRQVYQENRSGTP